MKKTIILSAIYLMSLNAFSQSISQTSPQNSNPASNTQLNGTYSNSNNSNSGVNPGGNPGSIISASAVESRGTFQTPVNPNIEPGTYLTSTGAFVPDPNIRYRSTPITRPARAGEVNVENPISIDSVATTVVAPEPIIPTPDFGPRRIDSLQRENDRRRAQVEANKRKAATAAPVRKVKRN